MVTLQGFIIVPQEALEIIKIELINHKRLTLLESGCITFSVTQDRNNSCKFNVYEEFIDQIAFEQHQIRVKSSDWGEVTKDAKRHYKVTVSE